MSNKEEKRVAPPSSVISHLIAFIVTTLIIGVALLLVYFPKLLFAFLLIAGGLWIYTVVYYIAYFYFQTDSSENQLNRLYLNIAETIRYDNKLDNNKTFDELVEEKERSPNGQ